MPRPRPLVIAHHLIWTAYGTWLPNDPRGSGSTRIKRPQLVELGAVHFGRKRVQPSGRVVGEFYRRAEKLLHHEVIRFDCGQIAAIAAAFCELIQRTPYTCYACAIMSDHVHLVMRKHRDRAEEMIERLQESSRLRLSAAGLVPAPHPVWTHGGWKVFLDSPERVRRTVEYVERNPGKEGLAAQKRPFVTAYDGWSFGARAR